MENKQLLIDPSRITDGEREEMIKLGILSEDNRIREYIYPDIHSGAPAN